jgi:hypothetical protein
MIHICKADHAIAPAWVKRVRAFFARVLTPVIRCAHCNRGFAPEDRMVSIDKSCGVYHWKCWDALCYWRVS